MTGLEPATTCLDIEGTDVPSIAFMPHFLRFCPDCLQTYSIFRPADKYCRQFLPYDGLRPYEEMYITEELYELRALSDYEFDSKKVFSNYENRKDAADFTTCIEQMTNEFSTFIEDIIRVKKIFMPFVDELCVCMLK